MGYRLTSCFICDRLRALLTIFGMKALWNQRFGRSVSQLVK